jgi:hypothetical protein
MFTLFCWMVAHRLFRYNRVNENALVKGLEVLCTNLKLFLKCTSEAKMKLLRISHE